MLQVCAVDFTAFHLLLPLMRASREAGWTVEFACADGPAVAAIRAEGFRHRAIPMSRRADPFAQARAILALARSLHADPPDLIHTHTPVGGLVGRAAAVLAGQRRIVHTFHGLPFHDDRRGPVASVFLAAERLLARRTTFFFSQAAGDAARAVRLGIARERDLLVIGNGIDLGRFQPSAAARSAARAELGVGPGTVVVATVARLVREKGLLELADAALALRGRADLAFLLVGTALPSDRDGVAEALATHAVTAALGPRWRLLGQRADVERVLAAADVFALPSHREGLPRSVIEAMAMGLPVVASDIPACRELVRDGETGLLVPSGDAPALAAALGALAGDAERRARYGTRGREIAREAYDERRIVARELAVFERLMAA